jgi:hypothetical protein
MARAILGRCVGISKRWKPAFRSTLASGPPPLAERPRRAVPNANRAPVAEVVDADICRSVDDERIVVLSHSGREST